MNKVIQFFSQVRTELGRVEWPKRKEFIGATAVTLMIVAFFTVYLGLVDKTNQYVIYETIFGRLK